MSEQISGIPPQPLPTNVTVGIAEGMADGQLMRFVQVALATPAGICVTFLPPEVAERVAEMLIQHSRVARTGLVVAGAGVPPEIKNGKPSG